MGKQTLLGIIGALGIASIAIEVRAYPLYALMLGVCAMVVILTVLILNFIFADRHPAEAMMEGTEMVALQHTLAAKGFTLSPNSAVIPDPRGGPPLPNPSQEADV